MFDYTKCKLGKKAPRFDHRTLKLENYLPNLPTIPASKNWYVPGMSLGMMLNDTLGDCTIAGAGHQIELWTKSSTGTEVVVPDSDVLTAYEAVSGYDPKTGQNDDGAVLLDVLNYWRQTGIGGHKIDAYVQVNTRNHAHMMAAMYLLGGVYLGVQLPISVQGASSWAVPPGGPYGDGAPGSWGGHCIDGCGYDSTGIKIISWGEIVPVTEQFVTTYIDEAYGIVSLDFLKNNVSPGGFDLDQLVADLKEVTN